MEEKKNEVHFVKIDAEQMKNANTYVPIIAKEGYAMMSAPNCIERIEMRTEGYGMSEPLPPMYKENTLKKSKYLMGALVKLYLGGDFEFEGNDEYLMTDEEYDKWARGHIMNQIERFKSDAKLRDICFDMMQDYKDLEKKLNTEVYSMIQIMNDPVGRILATIQTAISEEALNETKERMEAVKDSLRSMKEETDKTEAVKKKTAKSPAKKPAKKTTTKKKETDNIVSFTPKAEEDPDE